MDSKRRNALKTLSTWATLFGLSNMSEARDELSESELSKLRERMKQSQEREAKEVEQLYSTKPIHFRMGGHEYVVPVNYFTYKGRDEPDNTGDSKGFGFFLFLPDHGGYTKDNWRDEFDRRRVYVLEVKPVDKNAMIPLSLGGAHKIEPEGYGEPTARFRNHKRSLEEKPSFKRYGLEGYRRKGAGAHGTPSVTWTGTRSNGEFFFFESSLAPGKPLQPGITNPTCKTQYYSEQEDLFISYFYSQDHIGKWREIDDAIWTKLHAWQEK